jgi:MFS family permease
MPTLRQNLRALPPAAWILFLGVFLNRFGQFVLPFLVIYLTRRGYSTAQAGFAVGAYGAGHLISALLGGHLADRIGRRLTIVLSMFGSSVAMLALSQATTYASITALSVVAGLASELYRPAAAALLTDLTSPEQRVTVFSVYRLAINLGFCAGPSVAGFLADHSFTWLFYGDAITSAAFGVVALAFLPDGFRSSGEEERWSDALRFIARDRKFVLFLLATCCVTLVDFQTGTTFALHVRDAGYPSSTYGLLLSLNGILIVIFELALTSMTQRYVRRRVIALGYFLSCIGFALTGVAHSIPAIAATVVVWTLGEMIASPVTGAFVADLAPEHFRGRYMGIWTLTWSFGLLLGPPLGALAYGRNPNILWIACAILGVLSALLANWNPDRKQPVTLPARG